MIDIKSLPDTFTPDDIECVFGLAYPSSGQYKYYITFSHYDINVLLAKIPCGDERIVYIEKVTKDNGGIVKITPLYRWSISMKSWIRNRQVSTNI